MLLLFRAVVLGVALSIGGCGDATVSDVDVIQRVAATLPADQQALFQQWMPDVMTACTGLAGHLHELAFVEVALGDVPPAIVWHVPDTGTTIPAYWMAGGHDCALAYDAAQDVVTVAKEGCQNLCAGREEASGGSELLTIAIRR